MANSLTEVIRKLEQQREGIDRALAALREVEGSVAETAGSSAAANRGARKGGMTPEGRRRLSEALKARWAAKRAGKAAPGAGPGRAKRKGGITPEGRRRLSEALRKRWAAKRAGSATKKAARKS